MSQSTRSTRARGHDIVERVDDPEKTLRQNRRRRAAMDSSEIGLQDNAAPDNAPAQADVNVPPAAPAYPPITPPAADLRAAASTRTVAGTAPPAKAEQREQRADQKDDAGDVQNAPPQAPDSTDTVGTSVRDLLLRLQDAGSLQADQLPDLQSALAEFLNSSPTKVPAADGGEAESQSATAQKKTTKSPRNQLPVTQANVKSLIESEVTRQLQYKAPDSTDIVNTLRADDGFKDVLREMMVETWPRFCAPNQTEGQSIVQDEIARQVEGLLPNWTELITEAMHTDELLAEFNTAVANATTHAFDRDSNVE